MSQNKKQEVHVPVDQIEAAMRMKNLADEAKGKFALAFTDQTGLYPNEATMVYGRDVFEGRQVFTVKFVKNSFLEELDAGRAIIKALPSLLMKGNSDAALSLIRAHLAKFAQVE
jgi:hypothetical protein